MAGLSQLLDKWREQGTLHMLVGFSIIQTRGKLEYNGTIGEIRMVLTIKANQNECRVGKAYLAYQIR